MGWRWRGCVRRHAAPKWGWGHPLDPCLRNRKGAGARRPKDDENWVQGSTEPLVARRSERHWAWAAMQSILLAWRHTPHTTACFARCGPWAGLGRGRAPAQLFCHARRKWARRPPQTRPRFGAQACNGGITSPPTPLVSQRSHPSTFGFALPSSPPCRRHRSEYCSSPLTIQTYAGLQRDSLSFAGLYWGLPRGP